MPLGGLYQLWHLHIPGSLSVQLAPGAPCSDSGSEGHLGIPTRVYKASRKIEKNAYYLLLLGNFHGFHAQDQGTKARQWLGEGGNGRSQPRTTTILNEIMVFGSTTLFSNPNPPLFHGDMVFGGDRKAFTRRAGETHNLFMWKFFPEWCTGETSPK